MSNTDAGSVPMLKIGPIAVHRQFALVLGPDKEPIRLTPLEFKLLAALIDAKGQDIARDDLTARVFGRKVHAHTLRVTMHGLTKKLPLDEYGRRLIQPVRGFGFWLRAPDGTVPTTRQHLPMDRAA